MQTTPRPLIAVIGSGDTPPEHPNARLAFAFGQQLATHGFVLLCGGRGGIMEAASHGAKSAPETFFGATVGLLPGDDRTEANPYIDIPIATGIGLARNALVANADAIVAIGGGAGTLSEMAFAWQMRRLLIAFRVEGWSGKLADAPIDDRCRFPDIPDDKVYGASQPQDAISLLQTKLPLYRA